MFLAILYLNSSYKVFKGDEIIPNIMGYYGFIINTGSMEPTISTGDYIIAKKTNSNDIKEGDIITFIDEDILITHRIIKILEEPDGSRVFKTKGDANNVEDEYLVKTNDLIGKYVLAIPKLGYILSYMKHTNPLIIIGILIAIYLLSVLKENYKKLKKEDIKFEKIEY